MKMKARPICVKGMLAAVSVIAFLSGCGGGGGGGSPALNPAQTAPPTIFTSTTPTTLSGNLTSYSGDKTTNQYTQLTGTLDGSAIGNGVQLTSITINVTNSSGLAFTETFSNLAQTTDPTAPAGSTAKLLSQQKTDPDASIRTLTLIDPASLGLSYSTLGNWEYAASAGATALAGAYFSFGRLTAGSDIPTTGTGVYSGRMNGNYADGTKLYSVGADAAALANFGSNTVALTTSSTFKLDKSAPAGTPPTADSTLNITSGVLTYSPGTNTLSGTFATQNMSGPALGNFYGPAAAELGGTFFVKDGTNTQQMVGGFALKQ